MFRGTSTLKTARAVRVFTGARKCQNFWREHNVRNTSPCNENGLILVMGEYMSYVEAQAHAQFHLKSAESINYAEVARQFSCDETTLRRRHQGKQRSRRDADSTYKSRLSKQQELELVAYIHKLSSRGIPPTLPMIKNFAQDIAKTEVGKNWPYSFVQRYRQELGCSWFDGFDVARKRADNTSRYKAYFELVSQRPKSPVRG